MIHERGYWLSTREVRQHCFDAKLAWAVVALYSDCKSVVDIGCGNGLYTKYLMERGISCTGYDGSPLTPTITNGLCKILDFSIPQDIGIYDLVLCLEVGEHIPGKYEDIFIDNICKAASNVIIMSWAVEGQAGIGHVNCHNNDYVIGKMENKGFKLRKEDTDLLRDNSELSWFRNTLMVFERK